MMKNPGQERPDLDWHHPDMRKKYEEFRKQHHKEDNFIRDFSSVDVCGDAHHYCKQ